MTAELLALDAPVCPACGYDLRGIDSGRCPECGTPIDGAAVSRIPWVHRRLLGRWRAYWRTWAMATFRTGSLAAEVRRPVSHRDGQAFRWATVALMWPPLAGAASWAAARVPLGKMAQAAAGWHLSAMAFSGPNDTVLNPLPLGLTVPWLAGLATPGVAAAAVLTLLVLVTGVGSYLFRPRRLPVRWGNRAVAISYFAGAPLALTILPVAAAVLLAGEFSAVTPSGPLWTLPKAVRLLGWFAPVDGVLFVVLGTFLATVRLLRSATVAGWGWTAGASLLLALLWGATAAVALVGVPWVAGYVRLMVGSFL